MLTLRPGNERGRADFGWLKSQHSFSFGSYYDPAHMGFSKLRVINDDRVEPGAGFATHGHRNMEIISYVLSGAIAHKDSEGNVETLPPGEFQLMSAGSGITHSEYNASDKDGLHFLQIWIEPNAMNTKPAYQQKDFGQTAGLTHIISPDGKNGTLQILQDMNLYQLLLEEGKSIDVDASGRRLYVHLVQGELDVNGVVVKPGDGLKIDQESSLELKALQGARALLFDLP